jgi:hypothetical protein
MDKTQAQEIVDTVIELANRVDQSVKDVAAVATDRQAFDYRRLAGRMIAFLVTNLVRPALRAYPELEPESFKAPYVRLVDPPLDERVAQDVLRLVRDVERTAESFRFQRWNQSRDDEEFREGIDELMSAAASARAFIEKNHPGKLSTSNADFQS